MGIARTSVSNGGESKPSPISLPVARSTRGVSGQDDRRARSAQGLFCLRGGSGLLEQRPHFIEDPIADVATKLTYSAEAFELFRLPRVRQCGDTCQCPSIHMQEGVKINFILQAHVADESSRLFAEENHQFHHVLGTALGSSIGRYRLLRCRDRGGLVRVGPERTGDDLLAGFERITAETEASVQK